MKKFFVALTFMLILTGNHFAEATEFTREQVARMIAITVNNPAAKTSTLPFDTATFKQNYNDFMSNFIDGTSAGTDAFMMKKIFMLDDLKSAETDGGKIFAKNFLNKVVIIGLSNAKDKVTVLNIFAAPFEDKNDALFNVLVLQAFVAGITPGVDATALLEEINRSPTESAVHGGVKYSVNRQEGLNVVTAIAAN